MYSCVTCDALKSNVKAPLWINREVTQTFYADFIAKHIFDNKDLTWFKPRITDLVWFGFEIPKCGIYLNTAIKWRRKSEPSLIRGRVADSCRFYIVSLVLGWPPTCFNWHDVFVLSSLSVCGVMFDDCFGRMMRGLDGGVITSHQAVSIDARLCSTFWEDTGTQKSALNARPCGKLRQGITATSISMTVEHASHFW